VGESAEETQVRGGSLGERGEINLPASSHGWKRARKRKRSPTTKPRGGVGMARGVAATAAAFLPADNAATTFRVLPKSPVPSTASLPSGISEATTISGAETKAIPTKRRKKPAAISAKREGNGGGFAENRKSDVGYTETRKSDTGAG
jgi:hypothetical protein